MRSLEQDGRVTAVLGPTNTGKTHLALERMLGYDSGMIGFPLRLLARENYERIVKIKGANHVALVTGEERIVPKHPKYFICTVEAMPLERQVDFLAIDEIQLCGDPERGHIFTDRLLRARGRFETMFMGSDTIRGLLKKLVPSAEVIARPRFSSLSYSGHRKVTRLPPRSAVVAFSVSDVFEIAELVRRQRGGTAVVLGALSPRARNAQVALYQSGEVDYMVATDAIGMGLNMNLDHVAFARLHKFDGQGLRALTAPEMGQIAGRAGRHMNNGTFGTTADVGPLDPELVESVENHRFDPQTMVWWRNPHLDFNSGAALVRSLEQKASLSILRKVGEADDHVALIALLRNADIAQKATNPEMVRLLWDICQIPDFRKVMSEHHTRLLVQIFRYLTVPSGRLPTDWVAAQIARLDRLEGEIDTLVQRIAYIRTWTYITHRPNWIADGDHWQDRTRTIEDRLSDALHDRITQRFVDRRSAFLVRSLALTRDAIGHIDASGEIWVEGHSVGVLDGFQCRLEKGLVALEARAVLAAANRILRQEIPQRARQLAADPHDAFEMAGDGLLRWRGATIARLQAGETALSPVVEVFSADFLDGEVREEVRRRLERFVRSEIDTRLAPLAILMAASLPTHARGVAFCLYEGVGARETETVHDLIRALTPQEKKLLTRLGVRFGTQLTYLDPLLKPAPVAMRAFLWAIFKKLPLPVMLPPAGRISVDRVLIGDPGLGQAMGYPLVGPRAIRADRLEALAARLRAKVRLEKKFTLELDLARLIGCSMAELAHVVLAMGYKGATEDGKVKYRPRRSRMRQDGLCADTKQKDVSADHPFAQLQKISFG